MVESTLSYDLRDIRREGTDVVSITEDKLIEVFKLLEANKISKDAIKKLIESMCKNPDKSAEVVAEENNLSLLSLDDVKAIIEEIADKNDSMIKERQMGAMGPLMGMSMKQLKGKADGSTVNKIVKEEIQKRL